MPHPDTPAAAVRAFDGIVHDLARRHARGDRDLEQDLAQEGYIALAKAVDTYRDDRGASFETYAWARINWHLTRRAKVERRGGLTGDRAKSLGTFLYIDAPIDDDADPEAETTMHDLLIMQSPCPWALPTQRLDGIGDKTSTVILEGRAREARVQARSSRSAA